MLSSLREGGASAQQTLSVARDYYDLRVNMRIPGVASIEDVPMRKALRTGGAYEPNMFVQMFDSAMEPLLEEWRLQGLGFTLHQSQERIVGATWVDNHFIIAPDITQWEFMAKAQSDLLHTKYGWIWKPSSRQVLTHGIGEPCDAYKVDTIYGEPSYQHVDCMEALGGVLNVSDPTGAIIAHRFSKAEKLHFKYQQPFRGKAPVSLKLRAYVAKTRECALFLSSILHWTASSLRAALSWERATLRRTFRLKPKTR